MATAVLPNAREERGEVKVDWIFRMAVSLVRQSF